MRHFVLVPHEICVVPYGTGKFFLSEMIFNCDASPTAMTAPLQGAYKVSEKRNLELLNTFISPLKGEVDASIASRRKGWDTLCSRFVNNFQFTYKRITNMYDKYNRKIDYLRISLTDRCNLHCRYCQPEVSEHVPHNEILRYEELLRICRAALQLGIRKFKITGGEPLLRKGCSDFIASLKQLDGVEQVTLTTNGTLLSQQLPALIAAGVDSINVSLDTLDAAYYKELTGGSLSSVLQALQELQAAGIPFKLNCVPLAENGPADIMQLLKLAHRYNAPLRFIELMPLDCNTNLQGLSGSEIRSQLEQAGLQLQPDAQRYGNGPASYWRISGYKMPVGFIEPLHNKFCAVCNRVRLTSIGMLKPCLYSNEGMNLKRLLRDGGSDADLLQAMQEIIYAKPEGHSFDVEAAQFNMNQIGG